MNNKPSSLVDYAQEAVMARSASDIIFISLDIWGGGWPVVASLLLRHLIFLPTELTVLIS